MTITPSQLASVIRYHLGEMRAQNAHHDFEHSARHLARARVYSNFLPATGPVSSVGTKVETLEPSNRDRMAGNFRGDILAPFEGSQCRGRMLFRTKNTWK